MARSSQTEPNRTDRANQLFIINDGLLWNAFRAYYRSRVKGDSFENNPIHPVAQFEQSPKRNRVELRREFSIKYSLNVKLELILIKSVLKTYSYSSQQRIPPQ